MDATDIIKRYQSFDKTQEIISILDSEKGQHIAIDQMYGSARSILVTALFQQTLQKQLIILQDHEEAAYFYNDLQNLLQEKNLSTENKKVFFFPSSFKRSSSPDIKDSENTLLRTEVLKKLFSNNGSILVATYPEALSEKIIDHSYLKKNTLYLSQHDEINIEFIIDILNEYQFQQVDYVIEPGQYAKRGGIIDVFSFGNELPYRIEFFGDEVESIRTFSPSNQLSVNQIKTLSIIPNIHLTEDDTERISLIEAFDENSIIWINNLSTVSDLLNKSTNHIHDHYKNQTSDDEISSSKWAQLYSKTEFINDLSSHHSIEWGRSNAFPINLELVWKTTPQPIYKNHFHLLKEHLRTNQLQGITNYVFSVNPKQIDRLTAIFEDLPSGGNNEENSDQIYFNAITTDLSSGFEDHMLNITCYTDHQIFSRYHRFYLKHSFNTKESVSLKEINNLQPGDYITHIHHGIGQFDGLQTIDINGKKQETIRILYANGDLLYVNIHSLHRISKYTGKEGTAPKLHRLGSNVWQNTKNKTKKKVKDIAKELIALYAERKSDQGFAFSPDNYLQHELEASFVYEDTPDQYKTTQDVKRDMESSAPMDRLVCGDVCFGKTEIAIRAAFKAVIDSKQVAVLVPTTILALQHFKTFSKRLADLPCTVDYINRFKSAKAIKETLTKLKEGKIDILIGTHRLVSKDVVFKDLGLLIIDEEQKFGVSTKEKIRQLKSNIDTLTLTATPIPRTLQFSLMGARDLSIINTPPPNRFPIVTEIIPFNTDIICEAIKYELSRGGQLFFVHNRVKNIHEVGTMLQRLLPDIKIAIAHGQMEGKLLEQIMIDFMDGHYDILLSTTIIESGLDIANANTIIINNAQNYGLSELHQLRGRVGRSDKKAFCYLISPPLATLPPDARKRLQAIELFSELGSGLNIAMRDLDIRGAGNILGAEQNGFISDIGYDMYQKILNEAIHELKKSDFSEMYPQEPILLNKNEAQIETDLEILLPPDYVPNTSERLSLYKELDSIETQENLSQFEMHLKDRFGPLPASAQRLISVVQLRWNASLLGFSKIMIKSEKMVATFAFAKETDYYDSDTFSAILHYLGKEHKKCRMKESNDHLLIIFDNISTLNDAITIFDSIVDHINNSGQKITP